MMIDDDRRVACYVAPTAHAPVTIRIFITTYLHSWLYWLYEIRMVTIVKITTEYMNIIIIIIDYKYLDKY